MCLAVGVSLIHIEPIFPPLESDARLDESVHILLRLSKLNFKSRHFYFMYPLDGWSPFSAVTGAAGSTATATGAS